MGVDPAAEGSLLRRGRASSGRSTRCGAAATPRRASTSPRRPRGRSSSGATRPTSPATRSSCHRPASRRCSCGEGGFLLVTWRLSPSADLADGSLQRVRENSRERGRGADVGLARDDARRARDARLDRRGAVGSRRGARAPRRSPAAATPTGSGRSGSTARRERLLGPVHGLVGIVHALLQVDERAERRRSGARRPRSSPARRSSRTGSRPGRRSAGGRSLPSESEIRLQWCHGAPGMVATAAPYLDEELLLAGAELTWRAGAHREEKGAGLCHGTAGNGYALLEGLRAHRRRALARAGAPLRRPRARAGQTASGPAATRSSPATSVSPSSRPRASTRIARFPVLDGWD